MRITVVKQIAPTLSSRDAIDVVRRIIDAESEKTVILDFTGVTFVSRSAAHELLAMQREYNTRWQFWKQRRVTFENVSTDIHMMFNIASKPHHVSKAGIDLPSVDFQEFNR